MMLSVSYNASLTQTSTFINSNSYPSLWINHNSISNICHQEKKVKPS